MTDQLGPLPEPEFELDGMRIVSCDRYTADQMRAYALAEVSRAVQAEREACAKVCEAESAAHGGVAAGPMATERGKLVYESMAVGAKNCAAAIREGDK